MNAIETGDLLGLMAFYDNRILGDGDVVAWLQVIGDLDYADARAAVLAHYGGLATERMMPGHVRAGVRKIRADRIARSQIPAPPASLADHPRDYQRALLAAVKIAADGHALPAPQVQAITGGGRSGASGPTSFREAVSGVRKALGPGRAPRPALGDDRQMARDQVAELRAARKAAEPESGAS